MSDSNGSPVAAATLTCQTSTTGSDPQAFALKILCATNPRPRLVHHGYGVAKQIQNNSKSLKSQKVP